ncbi:MAG TPA: OmpA family protein [Candidatus Dormibacteraeota bacterium]|nr:OmpA family protein [Candidatus Dormibacteraeota bacterium]
MDRALAAGAWLVLGAIPAAQALEAADLKPVPGLVITNTVFATVVSSGASFGYMDTEDHFTLSTVGADGLTYEIRMSAPGNQRVEEIAARLKWPRHVRREDLEEATRMTLLYASTDPENYGGQTFAETSRKALTALKSGGETRFVFGPYAGASGEAGALAQLGAKPAPAPAPAAAGGAPPLPNFGQMFNMLLGSARHYYRGTLHRVESADVPVSVLVNGKRVELAAVHAAGTFTFAQDSQKAEIWWLDNPDWPLTLHWVFGPASDLVTRIDWPTGEGGGAAGRGAGAGGGGAGGGGGGGGGMAAELAGKNCHVELHGVYFNSGSAVLLEESEPMLKQVAALVKASPEASLTIEGHTDSIGGADYNQKLSERRAAAVRDALVSRYGIPAARLTAKGYGLTRPVESNDTVPGRAHNRRVELSRPCPAH